MPLRIGKQRKQSTNFEDEIASLHSEIQDEVGTNASDSNSSSTFFWKMISFVLFALVVLLIFDSTNVKEFGNASASNVAKKPHPSSEGENILSSEEVRSPAQPTTTPVTPASTPQQINVPSPSPAPQIISDENTSNGRLPTPTSNIVPTPFTYERRGQPVSDEHRNILETKWGKWDLVDVKDRPTNDFYSNYKNRDIPRAEFPSNAWQTDTEYLDKFLPEAVALVTRAQEAILAEYGKTDDGSTSLNERAKMFHVEMYPNEKLGEIKFPKEYAGTQGGWTTTRSWEGLKRRLLHAIMTEDTFVFAMGGHSAAAGHGNHFTQSYSLQVQWILEPIFARLGVRHVARNFGNGGLGTVHNGIAAGSVYGPDVDFLMWDSSMTEKEPQALDAFARQGLLGGVKVPVIWNMLPQVSTFLHDELGVDVGVVGNGYDGIEEMKDMSQLDHIPWAAQYIRCSGEIFSVCRENEYMGQCWIDRDDFTPTKKQTSLTGKAKWHPGNRKHQLTGRVITFTLLEALKEILVLWRDADGYVLSDDTWHMTSYYETTRSKLSSLPDEAGFCNKYAEQDIGFVCKYPVMSRTEFTPRAYPELSSIRAIMPSEQAILLKPKENCYNPPDVFNPNLYPPPEEIDVLTVVENGVDFKASLNPDYSWFYAIPSMTSVSQVSIGKGLMYLGKSGGDFCNGSIDSFCGRDCENSCLLQGHNDDRGGITFDGLSGWIVMNLPKVKFGYIAIKLETWHNSNSVTATEGWESINNEDVNRSLREPINQTLYSNRQLGKQPPPEYCDDFRFDYAIDGEITSLSLDEFLSKRKTVQRVVETITLMQNPDYTNGQDKQIEVAIRMTGCGRVKPFRMSHVYWS